MNKKEHWEKVYGDKAPDAVSWYAPHLETSLNLIHQASANKSAAVIDIGGGESTLVDDLLSEGYEDISVLDISQKAIDVARDRIGKQADKVHWYCADITQATLPKGYFDIWHDRAVFHFLSADYSWLDNKVGLVSIKPDARPQYPCEQVRRRHWLGLGAHRAYPDVQRALRSGRPASVGAVGVGAGYPLLGRQPAWPELRRRREGASVCRGRQGRHRGYQAG